MKKATKTCNIKFGDNLFNTRKSKKVSQNQIAELCNVSRQSVSDWETGKSQPDFVNLVKIAQHFNVSTDFLLGLTDVSSTNKATKELCSTLGLSETAIDILSEDENSPLAIEITEMLEVISEDDKREESTTNLIHNVTEDIRLTINKLIDDYAAHNPWCNDNHKKSEKPILYFLDEFYRALESPEEKYLWKDDGFEPLGNKIRITWANEKGNLSGYEEIVIKEYMANTSIAEITTRLHNIKHNALREETK